MRRVSAHALFAIQLAVDAIALLALVLILINFLKEPKRGPILYDCTEGRHPAALSGELLAAASSGHARTDETLLECAASADPFVPAAARVV